MNRYLKLTAASLLLFFITTHLKAQQTPTANSTSLKLFFEKAYLHLDREMYVVGDDIWYRAYLVNGQNNYPIYTSNNLYVELIAQDAKLISRQVIRLENGLGKGDFKLEDSLTAGTYRIRAYTNWMRNFGDNFIFEREIKVGNKPDDALATNKTNTLVSKGITSKTAASIKEDYRLQFFPEGGSLIADVASTVAFKAEDASGKGLLVQGNIIDSKGKAVATFKSNNLGMGSFLLTPIDGEVYDVKATAIRNNKPINSDFPIAASKGFALTVTNIDTGFVQATIKTNKATFATVKNELLTIEIKHTGKKFFEDSIRLTADQVTLKIAKSNLPEGIAVITLFDEKKRPNGERLFYVDRSNSTNFSLAINKKTYALQDNTIVNINVTDAIGRPLKTNLSVAVIDGAILPPASTNIVSYLLLQSELKGEIEHAETYFDKANPDRLQQLDFLLLTQGWRDFIWLRLVQQGINIKYIPEAGITVSGRVKRDFGDKPLPNMNITLRTPQATGSKLFSTQTDSSGRYYFDGIDMTGVQKIRLISKDNKGNKGGLITLDDLFQNPLPAKALAANEQIVDTSQSFKQFTTVANTRFKELTKIKQAEISELPGVTVTSKKEKTKLLADGMAMDAGYKDSVFTPDASDMRLYETLENYLLHKINGVQVDVDSGGVFFGGFKKTRPRFVVDNREDIFETLEYFRLTMNVISKVVVQHLVSAINPAKDIYVVNLTLKPEANQQNNPNLISTEITGYYQARQFYVPQPKAMATATKSFLTTQFWMPEIETVNGNAKVVISNKSVSPKWSIIVEGITENGKPVCGIVNYEVK